MGNEPVTLERATAHIRHWFTPALLSGAWAEDEELRLLRIFLTPVDAEPDAAAAAGLMDRFAAGDGRYWDSLRQFVGDRLVHDRPLGDTLRRWAGEVFRGDCTPPKKPRGAPPTMNPRNHLIVVAITLLLEEFDISATRNDASESVCACDAVVAVLAEREVLLAYKTVAAIWCQQPKNGYMPRDVTALFWIGRRLRTGRSRTGSAPSSRPDSPIEPMVTILREAKPLPAVAKRPGVSAQTS